MAWIIMLLLFLVWGWVPAAWGKGNTFGTALNLEDCPGITLKPSPSQPYSPPVRLAGARNEYLSFLLRLEGDSADLAVTVPVPSPNPDFRWRFFRVAAAPPQSVALGQADALCPVDEDFPGAVFVPGLLWVRLYVPPRCPPGSHRLVLRVSAGKGAVQVPVELRVYRFVLPEDLPLTIFGGFWHDVPLWTRGQPNHPLRTVSVIKAYYESLREYGFNALGGSYPLPLREAIARGGLKAFRDYQDLVDYALRVLNFKYFQIPKLQGWQEVHRPDSVFVQQASAFYPLFRKFLKTHGWENRALNYLADEPRPSQQEAVYQAYALAKSLIPEVRTLCAGWQPGGDFPRVIDIWAHQAARYQEALDLEAREKGQEAWLYANRLHGLDHPLCHQRLIGWLLYRYGFSGYLVWGVNYWPENPWTTPPGRHDFYRRGTFYYPHPKTGLPVATTRLEALRQGFQDYLYLWLLNKVVRQGLVPAARYQDIISKVTAFTHNLPRNPFPVTLRELEALRLEIGNLLDQTGTGVNPEEFN